MLHRMDTFAFVSSLPNGVGGDVTDRPVAPAAIAPLVGRDAELAELVDALAVERVITLTGSGGCGKTRLASELARRVGDRFAGQICWVELASRSDADGVTCALGDALDVIEVAGQAPVDRLISELRSRPPTLIVLDNAEHLVAATAELVDMIASSTEHVHVVTTSREPLGVPGEMVWRVPSLGAPPLDLAEHATTVDLLAYDSAQLFVERARRARRGFRVDDQMAPAVAQICARLDGVPLAIELAAARVRTMPPERIAAQLDDRFRLLAGGPRTLLERQQTLHASVAWSEALLDDVERLVFHRLAVFVGGFTMEAAERVVADLGDVDSYDVAEIVSRLVDKSLVQFDAVRDRYGLLETIRSFAMQRLLESGAASGARDAHAEFYATWLELVSGAADAASDGPHVWWDRRIAAVTIVDSEWTNCASALEWVAPQSRLAMRLVAGLGDFWAIRQRANESARYGMPPLLTGDRALAEWTTAVVRMQAVRTNALDPEYMAVRDDAVRLARSRDDRGTIVSLEVSPLITSVVIEGPLDEHLAALSALRDEARSLADWSTVWNTTQSPALILAAAGRVRDVDELVGDFVSSRFLLIRSAAALFRGQVAVSSELAREARRLVDARYGSTLDRMLIAFRAAGAALMSGDARTLDEMRSGDVNGEHLPRSLFSIHAMARGVEAIVSGDLVAARDELASAPPDLFASWRNVGVLAQVELALGDRDAARRSAEQLRSITERVDAPLYSTMADLVLAECDRDDDVLAALATAHRALAGAHDNELWPWAVDALETLGSMLVDVGRAREAGRLLRAAHEARLTMPYPFRFAHRAADVSRARAALADDDAGAAGWEEGADLALPDAIELAQRMRGERIRAHAGWESITPTEAQVIEQVVAGLTNPQIAERLIMSRATVKTHLVHVYAKLGISNRAELAVAATRRAAR